MVLTLNGVIVDGTSPVTSTPTQQNSSLPVGQDVTVLVTVKGSNGAVVNLTGYSAVMTIKSPVGLSPVLNLALVGTLSNPTQGQVQFTLTGAQLKAMLTGASYLFDVFTTNGSGGRDEVVPLSYLQLNPAPGA